VDCTAIQVWATCLLCACGSPPPRAEPKTQAPEAPEAIDTIVRFPDSTIEIRVHGGVWQRFHPGGALAEEGGWRDGKKDGAWRQLARDGRVIASYQMSAGTGVETIAWDDGTTREEITWKDGVRDGRARAWDEQGALVLDESWRAGVLDGDRTIGTEQAVARVVEHWSDGVRTGARTVSTLGELRIEETYDDQGRLHGTYRTWRDATKKREEGAYDHGVPTGTWIRYDKRGRVAHKGAYEPLPRTETPARDGVLRIDNTEISYVDGKREGHFTQSYADGTPMLEGEFTADAPSGEWRAYSPDGQVVTTTRYPR
jgi:antitoxin component YwqK of YwqJK toxin-antitoxin module